MNPRPAVSIILRTYNRARFLADAFASIGAQTHADWELIVIDDGSTDDTAAVVAQLSAAAIYRESIAGLERLRRSATFTAAQDRAYRSCLARHYFWHLGYLTLWQNGDRLGGLTAMQEGLRLTPSDLSMWKTYETSQARRLVGAGNPA